MRLIFLLLHALVICAEHLEIRPLVKNNLTFDRVQWPTRTKRSAPAVWGAPVPNYSNAILGPIVYLYTILFLDQKTVEHYSNNLEQAATEVVKLVRESNKYFFQLNIRIAVADILPTNRNDLTLYSFEDYHNAYLTSLPYHNFAVLVSFRYAGGLAFVSGFCSSKNIMMTGFYPQNPQAMASIFFHETCHLIGVSHTHSNETLDVPNCPCNSVTSTPISNAQIRNSTGQSMLSSTSRHVEGCLKIPGFDHNCTAQLAINLLHRSRCLSNTHRTQAQNKAEGYGAEPKTRRELLSICGNGIVEASEDCDCGLPGYCKELNCEPLICQHKVPIWVLVLSGIGLAFVFFTVLFVYVRFKLSSKRYAAVQTKMIGIPTAAPQADYLAIMNHLARLFQTLKSLLCKKQQTGVPEKNVYFPSTTKLDSKSIVVVRSAQQLPAGCKPPSRIERPKFPPPSLPRPKNPPPRPPNPTLKTYSYLEQDISFKFENFEDD